MKKYIPHICILIAGIIWGMIGLFNRHLIAGGFTPAHIVLTRNFGGLLLMTILFFITDRSVVRIKLRDLTYFLGTGVVSIVIFTLMYFSCQAQCSLAVAAILLYTAPAFVMILSAFLFHEPVTKHKFFALILAFTGCIFVSGILKGELSVTLFGLLSGIGSTPFFAPIALKTLISKEPLEENEKLLNTIKLDKDDYHLLRYYNMMVVNRPASAFLD